MAEGPAVGPVQEIRELYDFNRWANRRILEGASRLDPEAFARDLGSSFPSVRDTLGHILMAEWVWLMRWLGTSPSKIPDDWDLSTLDALLDRWRQVEEDQRRFVEGLTEDDLTRVLTYGNTNGQPFANPLREMLRHVVNHSTYHRGQVVTMLRQLGADGVATDLIRFYRERGSNSGADTADRR